MNPQRTYHTTGGIRTEEWRNEDEEFHRLDGPARRGWYEDGRPWLEGWYINGKPHRIDGPVYRLWHRGDQVSIEEWCVNGVRHRLDGPAYKYWDLNGQLSVVEWSIHDIKYETKAEFLVAVDLYKANEIAELF